MAEATTASVVPGRHQRKLRNYLLDAHFQLKYASYLVVIAFVLSSSLGFILYRTSNAVLAESRESVSIGEQVVDRGRLVVEESKKVNAVVQMNIVRDPAYGDNPALLTAFQADAKDQDDRLSLQQARLEEQSRYLKTESVKLTERQRAVGTALVVVLALLVVGVGLGGIVVTHRVAGPIYKMKRQLRDLGNGNFQIPYPLRKGDELVDFFEAFRTMVKQLRERQEQEIALLDRAISNLAEKANEDDVTELRSLREKMQRSLEV